MYVLSILILYLNYCNAQVGYSPKTPGSDSYQPPNPYETTTSISNGYEMTPSIFPLDNCYFNKHGFMCCNKELEALMEKVYDDKEKSRKGKWPGCNIHQIATDVQKAAEAKFGIDFESISSAGDFASRNHFSGDFICKIKRGPQHILAYATPH